MTEQPLGIQYQVDQTSNPKRILAIGEGTLLGSVTYYPSDEFIPAFLENISVKAKRRGIGQGLIGELCKCLGPNCPLSCVVTHPETLAYLRARGLLSKEAVEYRVAEKMLLSIPFVRFLRSGGLVVSEVVIRKGCGFLDDYIVELAGKTGS